MTQDANDLQFAIETVRAAGAHALQHFHTRDFERRTKSDETLVTSADLEANEMLVAALRRRFPTDAILSEESPDDPARLNNPRCWIVDPIDGTNNFAAGRTNWAVLLALAVHGEPVLGVMFGPALGLMTAGSPGRAVRELDGRLADWWIDASAVPPLRLALASSARYLEESASRTGEIEAFHAAVGLMGSITLFADGVHAYVADPTGTHEWDIAAVDAVIRGLGGRVTDFAGANRVYNQPEPKVRGGLVAAVNADAHARVVDLIRTARS